MTSTALAAPRMAMGSLEDPEALGRVLAASGYFSDARDAAQAVVKVLAGAELGFGPIASMTGVYIVKGRVTLSANLIAAAIKRHPRYDFKVRELTNDQCAVVYLEDGKEAGTSEFTIEDAKAAGLAGGDNWKKFPRNMLFARALSNGAKWFCPDVFSGSPIYTPDELGAEVDPETGEILTIDEPVAAAAPPQPKPKPPAPKPKPEPEPEPAPVNTDDPVSDEEAQAMRDFLDRVGAPESFWRMGLMTLGIDELGQLTKGQARKLMEDAKARYAEA